MYEKIANYYDDLGWSEHSIKEFDIINNILMEYNIVPEKVCDLGCGTGELIKLLSDVHDEASYVGIDISGDMINVAKKKCKKIEECVLVSGDIRNFKLEKRANLITCMYDTINHLLNKEHWGATFKSAYEALKFGGVFILDFVPGGYLPKWEGEYVREEEAGTLVRMIKYDKEENTLTTHINAFVKSGFMGTFKNVTGDVVETSFPVKDVIKMLKDAGFKKVVMYTEDFKKVRSKGKANKLVPLW